MSIRFTRALGLGMLLCIGAPGMAQAPWLVPYGDGGCSGGFVPTLHTGGEMPTIGNAGFQVVSENLKGGALGLMLLSSAQTSQPVLGMRLYVGPTPLFAVGCQATGTGAAGAGIARLGLPIPGSNALVGGRLFLQGFFLDPTLPAAPVHTQGLEVTIAQTISGGLAAIRDRKNYQARFAGFNQTQADLLGAAIWGVNQVAGFSYLRTERFSCAGESHWMIIVLHAGTGMEFCLIPGGSFRMGDINGTNYNRESPVRRVHIRPFLIARTEVTQAQFTAIMGTSPWQGQQNVVGGRDYAASYIDWNDSAAFCARTGLRLPSEAEWEYACRAGTTSCFHHGENHPTTTALENYAWFFDNTWNQTYAHQVGQKRPNAFGLSDMHGNVWEWVQDDWAPSGDYQCAPTDGRAWLGNPSRRIMRGGSWTGLSMSCRSANRPMVVPSRRIFDLGFRPCGPSL